MMIYAGIGSRATPMPVLDMMNLIGMTLAQKGFTLRSGRAVGADSAFETGASLAGGRMELFTKGHYLLWLEHAARFHPNWAACDEAARGLHARNSAIMLGAHLNEPVSFVVCWTEGGAVKGGTGQALRIAAAYNIPVFNLFWPEHGAALWEWIGKIS